MSQNHEITFFSFSDFPSSASSSSSQPDESDSGLSGLDLNDSSGSVTNKLIRRHIEQQQEQRLGSGLAGIILDESHSKSADPSGRNWSSATNEDDKTDNFETQSLEGLSQSLSCSSVATISTRAAAAAAGVSKGPTSSTSKEDLTRCLAVSSPALSAPPNLTAAATNHSHYDTLDQNRMVLKQLPR